MFKFEFVHLYKNIKTKKIVFKSFSDVKPNIIQYILSIIEYILSISFR